MKVYKFELKYPLVVDISAEDLDDALQKIQDYITANPGPTTPDIKILSTNDPE